MEVSVKVPQKTKMDLPRDAAHGKWSPALFVYICLLQHNTQLRNRPRSASRWADKESEEQKHSGVLFQYQEDNHAIFRRADAAGALQWNESDPTRQMFALSLSLVCGF